MNIKKLLKTPFGLTGDKRPSRRLPSYRLDANTGMVSRDYVVGFRPGDPAQSNGQCVGRGTANLCEILLLMHNPLAMQRGEQIDGDRLYLWIRDQYYDDQNLDAGATLLDGVRAAMGCGILPPDCVNSPIDIEQAAIADAYSQGPLLQGHEVDSQWSKCPANGLIGGPVGASLGGHCTVGLGQWFFKGGEAEYLGGNSWGDGFGNHGRFRMGWDRFQQTCVDIWQVRVNPKSVAKWTGHREWIKR